MYWQEVSSTHPQDQQKRQGAPSSSTRLLTRAYPADGVVVGQDSTRSDRLHPPVSRRKIVVWYPAARARAHLTDEASRSTQVTFGARSVPIGYLLTRTAQLVPIVFIAVTINFMIPRLIPGDPIEAALQTRIAMTGSIDANVAEIAGRLPRQVRPGQAALAAVPDLLGRYLPARPRRLAGRLPAAGDLQGSLGAALDARPARRLDVDGVRAWDDPRGAGRLAARAALRQALLPPFMLMSAIPFFLLAILLLWIFAVELRVFPPGGGFDPITMIRFNLVDHRRHRLPRHAALAGAGARRASAPGRSGCAR